MVTLNVDKNIESLWYMAETQILLYINYALIKKINIKSEKDKYHIISLIRRMIWTEELRGLPCMGSQRVRHN